MSEAFAVGDTVYKKPIPGVLIDRRPFVIRTITTPPLVTGQEDVGQNVMMQGVSTITEQPPDNYMIEYNGYTETLPGRDITKEKPNDTEYKDYLYIYDTLFTTPDWARNTEDERKRYLYIDLDGNQTTEPILKKNGGKYNKKKTNKKRFRKSSLIKRRKIKSLRKKV